MKQLLCCSYTGSFNVFLQLPSNSIFPLSVVYGIMGWGCLYVCIHACMYLCINVCISLNMYVLCMQVSVYVCMYHTYVHDACRPKYAINIFYNITLFNCFKWFSE